MANRPTTPLQREITRRLQQRFTAAADPSAAAGMQAYMRDQFPFFGISAKPRVVLTRETLADLERPGADDLRALALDLWTRPEREYQYAAVWYLRRFATDLPADFIGTVRTLVTTRSWWDTVDELAGNVVGPLVLHHPRLPGVMDEWIGDENLWLARTAILHQLGYKDRTDADRLFRYCLRQSGHPDFFIRKAIGWALRAYSKTDERAVRRFVAEHGTELSGLSRREALKWLDRRAMRPAAPR